MSHHLNRRRSRLERWQLGLMLAGLALTVATWALSYVPGMPLAGLVATLAAAGLMWLAAGCATLVEWRRTRRSMRHERPPR